MFTTKDKLLIGGGFILAVLLVIVGIFFGPKSSEDKEGGPTIPPQFAQQVDVRVEFVEPLQDQKGVSVVAQINVKLSGIITGKSVELQASPKAKFGAQISKSGDKVTFSPQTNLKPNTTYSFQFIVEGQPIFSWNATTKSGGTTQKNLAAVVTKIRSKTPFTGSGFRVSYDAATDQFFVFVEKAPVEATKAKANQWLSEQGLKDFEALNINYVVKGSLLR